MAKEKRRIKTTFKILNVVSIVAAIFMLQLSRGVSREIDEINTVKRNEYISTKYDINYIVENPTYKQVMEPELKATLKPALKIFGIKIPVPKTTEKKHVKTTPKFVQDMEKDRIRLERRVDELKRIVETKNKVIEDKNLLKAIYDVIAVIGVIVGTILGIIQLLQFLNILPDKIGLKITKA